MSDLHLDSQRVKDVLDELVTYENITTYDPLTFFGMVAEKLNCVCIDKENLLYAYINQQGEIEDGCDMYILNKVIKIIYKYGYEDRVRKCWKKT
jgi:hypothetical protein